MVLSAAATPDGKRLVSTAGTTLRYWDLSTGTVLRDLAGHTDIVNSVAVTPDGKHAVSGAGYERGARQPKDTTIKYWDLDAGTCIRTLTGHSGAVYSVAVTPGGTHAVSGSGDATLKYWDLRTGACIRTLRGHSDRVNSVAVTPDGKHAVSGRAIRRGSSTRPSSTGTWAQAHACGR
jgi:WD40 repeat protein